MTDRAPLRIAALELPARWGDADAAFADADAILTAGPAADLVLLPELSLTGYVSPRGAFDVRPFAEPLDGPTARRLAELARAHALHVAGPLVLAEGDDTFNALALFDPRGQLVFAYRKRHPWYPEDWAKPGGAPAPLVRIGDTRLTAAICFDVHFLADEHGDALREADVLLFPSAWVEERGDEGLRQRLIVELARGFDVAVVNANWGVGLPRVRGQGGR